MKNNNASPIFIHSLFRSGSTYIFNVFRRSQEGYYCFQEPLNEHLIYSATDPERLLDIDKETQEYLRHPKFDKPYFDEFYKLADKIGVVFRKEFSYDHFFNSGNEGLVDLKKYFTVLMNESQGQPFFQCCRSAGRVSQLKAEFGGVHIFLWRNPWDQWWSFKKGFDTNNLLIYNSNKLPPFLDTLKKALDLPELHDSDTFIEYEFFNKRWLDSSSSYKVFYALWCYAMLETQLNCDISISIDELSISNIYRNKILVQLEKNGINGIDFSDCSIPKSLYGESDAEFFLKVESYIHGLLLSHGYSHAQVGKLMQMSEARNELVVETNAPKNSFVRDAMRAREYLQKAEAELVSYWNVIRDKHTQLINSNEHAKHLESEIIQLKTELDQSEKVKTQLETTLSYAETSNLKLKDEVGSLHQSNSQWSLAANQLEEELNAVYMSKSWRIMLLLRTIMHFLIRLPRQSIQLARTFTIATMRYVIKQPRLKKLALVILFKFPRIKTYLNTLALRAGLSTKEINHWGYIENKVAENETGCALSPNALRVYAELKQAIELRDK